jgi:hypothetical protein
LPPVSPPFIWYPYGISPDFPQMGTGGRTAMAGRFIIQISILVKMVYLIIIMEKFSSMNG